MERYLSISDVARRVGLPVDGMTHYRKTMPEPAARVGQSDGWTEKQIDEWDASRRKHSPTANTRSGNRAKAKACQR